MLKAFLRKKVSKSGTHMGLVIAIDRDNVAPNAKTSEWQRAAPKPGGGIPATLASGFL